MRNMLQPAPGRTKIKLSVLGDELYVLNKYSDMSPSFHLTADDVNMEMDFYRATPGSIVSHGFFEDFLGR